MKERANSYAKYVKEMYKPKQVTDSDGDYQIPRK